MTLRCIACGAELKSALSEDVQGMYGVDNQPYAGTAFESHGHYGSMFFDPMDGSKIEINVCDDCLREHDHQDFIARYPVPSQGDEDRLTVVLAAGLLATGSAQCADEETARRVARYVLGRPGQVEDSGSAKEGNSAE